MENRGFLLDTHIFIRAMGGGRTLPPKTISLLQDPRQQIFISVATVWEIVIKKVKKKLKVPTDIERGIKASGFVQLPIEISHVLGIEILPLYHKDPFDRLLISQAKVENLTLITSDEKIWRYDLSLLKA